jgi:hypothetical protein
MANIWAVPVQLPDTGVTVIVAVTGVEPVLIAVNDAIVALVPLAAKPMLIVLLVQLYAVAVPTNVINPVPAPLHTVWSVGSFTVGVGSTVIVKV